LRRCSDFLEADPIALGVAPDHVGTFRSLLRWIDV